MNKADLRLDWCSHAAAKYAVERWHYSRSMPAGKMVKVGAWEGSDFIGALLFSRGAAINIGSPFGLKQTEVCELTRVALRIHSTPVSRALRIAVKMLVDLCPALRLIVSFADTEQGHHGGIYQAAGWLYIGSNAYHQYRVCGQLVHPKTLHSRYGEGGQSIPWLRTHIDKSAERVDGLAKHKYVWPLDAAMREQIARLAKPYPKRPSSIAVDAPGTQPGDGGSTPTDGLEVCEASA